METMLIPGYDILDELGHGGMATVYLARHLDSNRLMALKIMSPGLARDRSFTRRFLKEKRLIASMDNPHIVSVFESGVHEEQYFFSMEYLPGGTLKRRIHQGLTLEDSLQIIKTLAGALEHAHERHLVHRDIKPQNILFRGSREPVLSDFGIAKSLEGNTALTQSGQFLGSPQYMSPEQAKGLSVDTRADIYSLGVVFFEMLTGRLPFQAEDNIALAIKHITEPVPMLPLPLAHFQPVIDRLLAKHPNQRFQNLAQFTAMLEMAERRYSASFNGSEGATLPLAAVDSGSSTVASTRQIEHTRPVRAISDTLAITNSTLAPSRRLSASASTPPGSTWDATTGITTVVLGTILGGSLLALLGRLLSESLDRQLVFLHHSTVNTLLTYLVDYAMQGIFLVVVLATLLSSAFSHQRRSIWSALARDRNTPGKVFGVDPGEAILTILRWLLAGTALGMATAIVIDLLGLVQMQVSAGALLGLLASALLLTLVLAWRFGQWAGDLIGGQLRARLQDLD